MKKIEKTDSKKNLGLSDINELNAEIKKNQLQNLRIGNSELRLIGDKMILVQIIKLLAYIRYAVKNNLKTEIKVKIGEKIANGQFMFDVNQSEISDLITQDSIEIS